MCANAALLTGMLRDAWKFTGYVVTDCNAFDAIHSEHHYTESLEATINASYVRDGSHTMNYALITTNI